MNLRIVKVIRLRRKAPPRLHDGPEVDKVFACEPRSRLIMQTEDIMARAGRKRKTNVVRDASGKSRGEKFDPDFIYNQPHRRATAQPWSAQAGSPLGRLKLNGTISEAQLRAGEAYARLVHAYARTMGLKIGSPRSGAVPELVSSGFYAWESDRELQTVGEGDDSAEDAVNREQKRIRELKARYDDCHAALLDVSRTHRRGLRILSVLRDICIFERNEHTLTRDEEKKGDLRLGLNTVERAMGR